MKLDNSVKNIMLNNAFKPTTLYISIPAVIGAGASTPLPNVVATFNTAVDGIIRLATPLQFAVIQDTLVDKVYISQTPLVNNSNSNLYDLITLEGNDIKMFENNGIYLINTINIGLVERV